MGIVDLSAEELSQSAVIVFNGFIALCPVRATPMLALTLAQSPLLCVLWHLVYVLPVEYTLLHCSPSVRSRVNPCGVGLPHLHGRRMRGGGGGGVAGAAGAASMITPPEPLLLRHCEGL